MLNTQNVWKGGLTVMAAVASLAVPQTASAEHNSRGCGNYNAPTTYVSYQPAHYAPVYTDRQVAYTAPVRSPRVEYVERAPVREVVRYVPQPVRTRTVYVQPRRDYYPRTVRYSSRHHNRHSDYGYRTSHHGSRHGPRYSRHGSRHGSRGFRLDVGRLHIGARRGHHGGVSVRVGH